MHSPIRVIANGKGSEVFFALIHQSGVSHKKFGQDATWVENIEKFIGEIFMKFARGQDRRTLP